MDKSLTQRTNQINCHSKPQELCMILIYLCQRVVNVKVAEMPPEVNFFLLAEAMLYGKEEKVKTLQSHKIKKENW